METEFSERFIKILEDKRLKKKLKGDLDGLISDWVVQSNIVTALERTQEAKKVIENTLKTL